MSWSRNGRIEAATVVADLDNELAAKRGRLVEGVKGDTARLRMIRKRAKRFCLATNAKRSRGRSCSSRKL